MENKFWKGFLSGCLASFILFVLFIFGIIKIFTWDTNPNQYTDINNYQKIKEDIKRQDKIMHFPETIPPEAMNVELYGFSHMPYGAEALMLSFYIDSDYIDNEFKKYEFINKNDKIGQKQELYNVYKMNDKFKETDFTYFVFKNKDNEEIKKLFPYYNGIGIDKTKKRILYYYMMFGD